MGPRAFRLQPVRVVSGSNEQRCGAVEADAVEASSEGAVAATNLLSMWSMLAISMLRCCIRRARFRITVLVVKVTGSEPLRGRILAASVTRPVL